MRRDLGEAADVAHHDRLAEREGRVQDARLLGVAVRQDDEVGAAEVRRELGVVDEARARSARGPARAAASSRSASSGHAEGPARRSRARRPRPSGTPRAARRRPCRGGSGRRRGSPGPSTAASSRRQRRLVRQAGQVVEGAVGDDADALRGRRPASSRAARARAPRGRRPRPCGRVRGAGRAQRRRSSPPRGARRGRSAPAAGPAAAGGRRAPGPAATGSGRRRRRRRSVR